MQVPATPLASHVGGGEPLLVPLEDELDEVPDEPDELLLDEVDDDPLDELDDDPELVANAWSCASVPLNTSRSAWSLSPGELPVPVYCQKTHDVHGVGIVGQLVV